MEVKYVEKGEPGKTCADCGFYQAGEDGKGKCFGYEVLARGGCVLFKPKAETAKKYSSDIHRPTLAAF